MRPEQPTAGGKALMGILAVPIPEYRKFRKPRLITELDHAELVTECRETRPMIASSEDAIRFAHDENELSVGSSTNWYVLLFAVIITLFAVYWGFVRPTQRQLTKMRRYVTSLETSIAELNGQRQNNEATLSLLDQLVQQGNATSNATAALDEIRSLHRQIVVESEQLSAARIALESFGSLRTEVARQSTLIEATDRALASISDLSTRVTEAAGETDEARVAVERISSLRDGLIESINMMEDTRPILSSVEQLHTRLSESSEQTQKARVVSENLLAIEEDLLNRGSYAETAQLALNDLIDLRDKVEAEATTIEKADATLSRMVDLQGNVVAQTEAVAVALETLELATDVQMDMRRVGHTFGGVKQMLNEMVLMQPKLEEAMGMLEPLAKLSDLRRLNVRGLREVANVISTRYTAIGAVAEELPSQIVADATNKTVK